MAPATVPPSKAHPKGLEVVTFVIVKVIVVFAMSNLDSCAFRRLQTRAANFLTAVAVASLTIIAYLLGGVSRSFINLDDPAYIYENLHVRNGLTVDGVRWALSAFHSSNWHPLTWISHMLDVSLFGLNPVGHHVMSIALHALTAALLFLALRSMTGAPWPSAFVAALFGVHPQHVESVAWAAERKDVLSGLLFVLVLLAYVTWIRRGGALRYLALVSLLALGLMAKPMLVTLPFTLLLLDIWPLGRTRVTPPVNGAAWQPLPWLRLLTEKVPLIALSVVSSIITFLAQQSTKTVVGFDVIPPGARFANVLVSAVKYLVKTVWPTSLAVYYPFPPSGYPWWQPAVAALILLMVTIAAVVWIRRHPYLAVGWFWFLGMLVPVIGLVQVGGQAMADRYMYLPHIGLFILATWGLAALTRQVRWKREVLTACGVAVLALFSIAATRQVRYWHDGITLYNHTLAVTTGNPIIRADLGVLLDDQGRFAEAVTQYREAVRLYPRHAQNINNLAVSLVKLGRFEEAAYWYREALRLSPDLVDCRLNFAQLLVRLGRRDEAVSQFREIVRVHPELVGARFRLGNTLAELGRFEEAVLQFRETTRQMPGLVHVYFYLGSALTSLGRLDEAAQTYRELLLQQPNSAEAQTNLAATLLRLKKFEEAASQNQEALRLHPGGLLTSPRAGQ